MLAKCAVEMFNLSLKELGLTTIVWSGLVSGFSKCVDCVVIPLNNRTRERVRESE